MAVRKQVGMVRQAVGLDMPGEATVAFLVGPDSGWINGQVLRHRRMV